MYPVIAEPPSDAGASQSRVIAVSYGVTPEALLRLSGTPGGDPATMLSKISDEEESPTTLTVITMKE